jgi:hypothetical protein
MIPLSRIPVVGCISNHTPRVVIREIAMAHGLEYDSSRSQNYSYHCQMVTSIMKWKVFTVETPFNEKDWSRIARFISPSLPITYWPELNSEVQTKHSLKEAFERHLEFRETIHFDFPAKIQYGEMTPMNLKLFDACTLYRYCGLRQFNLDWRSTIADMIDMITIDIQADLYTIKRRIITLINRIDIPKRSLINALHSLSQTKSTTPISPLSIINQFDNHKSSMKFDKSNTFSVNLNHITEDLNNIKKPNTAVTDNVTEIWKEKRKEKREEKRQEERNGTRTIRKSKGDRIDILSNLLDSAVELWRSVPEITDEIVLDDNGKHLQVNVYDIETEMPGIRGTSNGKSSSDIMNAIDYEQLRHDILVIIQTERSNIEITLAGSSINHYMARLSGSIVDDQDMMTQLHHQLRNIKVKDHCTAVIHMACNYLLDVSDAESPLTEYYRYLSHDGVANDYQPISSNLRRRMNYRRRYVDGIVLSHVFNPYLDSALYQTQTLRSLATYYGLDVSHDHQTLYNTLREASLLNTFYPGIMDPNGRHQQTETPLVLEDIDDLEPWEAVSYGNRMDGYQVMTYTELNGMFNREGYCRIVNDDKNCTEMYTPEQINHLRIIASRQLYDNENDDNIAIRHELISTINRILSSTRNMTSDEILMLNYCRQSEENRQGVDSILEAFLDLTMKMRGWDGKGPYPVSRTPTCDLTQVYINVDNSFNRYDECFANNLEAGKLFESLPLYRYNKDQRIYIISNDLDDGLTIGDRLNIVRQGENTTNINSCIRMTSNWFIATYSHISSLLGKMVEFNLDRMREIS